jgi:hypothetical protein
MTQDKKSHNHERDHACYSDQFYRMRGFYACMRKMLMHVSVDISLTALHWRIKWQNVNATYYMATLCVNYIAHHKHQVEELLDERGEFFPVIRWGGLPLVTQTSEKDLPNHSFSKCKKNRHLHYINDWRTTDLSFFGSLNKLSHNLLGTPHSKWQVRDITCFLEILHDRLNAWSSYDYAQNVNALFCWYITHRTVLTR